MDVLITEMISRQLLVYSELHDAQVIRGNKV